MTTDRNSDLTIIVPTKNEANNLAKLLPQLHEVAASLIINFEIIVVDEDPDEQTITIVENNGSVLISPRTNGYGAAILAGIKYSKSKFVITMDADLSHSPSFLRDLWKMRGLADIVVASRYIHGGKANMPLFRILLSKILNHVFSRGLDLRIQDMSSGFRLYHRVSVERLHLVSKDFDIQQEILVKSLAEGYRVLEIPFTYQPRKYGSSNARIFRFGMAYLKTFSRLWKLRNSIESADYDSRAYDSWIFIQRYWQRQRYKHIIELSKGINRVIDIGCGSSRILEGLPSDSIGLDIQFRKLRYARRYEVKLIQGDALDLPLKSNTFPCVICSQVIEHVDGSKILDEIDRILAPRGLLILGTPDYSKWQWRIIEWIYGKLLPQAYADEHITQYSLSRLIQEFVETRGYTLTATRYILQGELIMAMKKPE